MTLPIINAPKYSITLPITKQTLQYRAFLVKEEKILLMLEERVKDMEPPKALAEVASALNEIITNCTFGKIEAAILPLADFSYLILQIRAKSIRAKQQVNIDCSSCYSANIQEIDLETIIPDINPIHTNVIKITDTVGLIMKYPTVDMLPSMADGLKSLDLIRDCIDSVYEGEQIFKASDHTKAELDELLENLSKDEFEKIGVFFETAPELRKVVEFKCVKCNHENKYTLEGLQSFFTL
jgi:hypothetical protein